MTGTAKHDCCPPCGGSLSSLLTLDRSKSDPIIMWTASQSDEQPCLWKYIQKGKHSKAQWQHKVQAQKSIEQFKSLVKNDSSKHREDKTWYTPAFPSVNGK